MARICPNCGRANNDDARFCGGCGRELPAACASCGAALAPGAAFCTSCGTPAAATGEAATGEATAAAGEATAEQAAAPAEPQQPAETAAEPAEPAPEPLPEQAPAPSPDETAVTQAGAAAAGASAEAAAAPQATPYVTPPVASQPPAEGYTPPAQTPPAQPLAETPPAQAYTPQTYGAPTTPAYGAPAGPAQPPTTPPPGGAGGAPAPGGPRKGAPVWLIILIVVLVLAAVAAAATFIVFSGDGDGDKTPTPVATAATATPTPTPSGTPYLAAIIGKKGAELGTIDPNGNVSDGLATVGPWPSQLGYSPDGQWIACIGGGWKRPVLRLVETATGKPWRISISTPRIVAMDSFAWLSADELLVAGFTTPSKFRGEDAELVIYHPSDDTTEPLQDADGNSLRGVSVSASADGSKVVFVTYTDQKKDEYDMWSATENLNFLDRDDGTVTTLGSGEAYFDVNARRFDDPLISPTGSAIIYRRAGSDVGTAYTVIDTSGATIMPAKELLYPAGYAWDPSGQKVVFTGQPTSSTGKAATAFYLFDLSVGGKPKVIAKYKDTFVQDLAWSPDGSVIAWSDWDEKNYRSGTMYLTSPEGGDAQWFANWAIFPAWAPGAVGTSAALPEGD